MPQIVDIKTSNSTAKHEQNHERHGKADQQYAATVADSTTLAIHDSRTGWLTLRKIGGITHIGEVNVM